MVEISQFLQSKEAIYYEDATKVLHDIVTKTTEGEKNFFGQFKSQMTSEWSILCRLYEKDNLKRAEMAKRLQQTNAHDIPALKKNLKSLQKQIQEYDAKIVTLNASIESLKLKHQEGCSKLGLDPAKDLEEQIYGLVQNLPHTFGLIETEVRSIKPQVKNYQEQSGDIDALCLLDWFISNGDTTTGEWTNRVVSKVEDKYLIYSRLGSTVQQAPEPLVELDWTKIDNSDFGIELVNDEIAIIKTPQPIEVETLLYNQETRQRLVNDLEELLCYLQQRQFELGREDQAMFDVYSQKETNLLRQQCDEQITPAILQIQTVLDLVNGTLQLIQIRTRPKQTAQRMMQSLGAPLSLRQKQELNLQTIQKKRKEAKAEADETTKQLAQLSKDSAMLADLIQQEMQKTNIMIKIII